MEKRFTSSVLSRISWWALWTFRPRWTCRGCAICTAVTGSRWSRCGCCSVWRFAIWSWLASLAIFSVLKILTDARLQNQKTVTTFPFFPAGPGLPAFPTWHVQPVKKEQNHFSSKNCKFFTLCRLSTISFTAIIISWRLYWSTVLLRLWLPTSSTAAATSSTST